MVLIGGGVLDDVIVIMLFDVFFNVMCLVYFGMFEVSFVIISDDIILYGLVGIVYFDVEIEVWDII